MFLLLLDNFTCGKNFSTHMMLCCGTVIGIECKDEVVMALAGLAADGMQIVAGAKSEAYNYDSWFAPFADHPLFFLNMYIILPCLLIKLIHYLYDWIVICYKG
ncbi:putative proteasome endopeptidase complex [Medicago truncatula]|uniref:Putative proteasome endopeptidase complex n=1 Tax=Medicago truncatula TaxID=3880 RepID=A0A396HBF7_MEDTR|nr:putative proteasome endopeptidase complex [Medicago truncatula]